MLHPYHILQKFLLISLCFVKCRLEIGENINRIQPCVFEYNSSLIGQGEVYSPNYPNSYPNNLNCRYEFYGRENERVIIQIEDFQLESPQSTSIQEINFLDYIETVTRRGSEDGGENKDWKKKLDLSHISSGGDMASESLNQMSNRQCFYDFLDVFTSDGHGRLNWRSRHCGSSIDSQIVSTSPILILVFKTDRMLAYRGFKLRFHFSYINILPFVTDPICGPSEITGNGSVLSSPNYPLQFPSNVECAWTIRVEERQNILIKFMDVNLNQPCHISHVNIWDGYVGDSAKPDFVVCEKLIYYHKGILQYKSKSNRIVIKFVGNKNVDGGFKLRNNLVENNSVNSQNLVNRTADTNEKVFESARIKYGFYLSWSGVHLADQCGPSDFMCKGGEYCIDSKNYLCQPTYKYCISKKLVCDGVFNCDIGDDSDEKHCELSYIQSKFYMRIAAVGGIVFILLTILCIIFYHVNKQDEPLSDFSNIEKNSSPSSKYNMGGKIDKFNHSTNYMPNTMPKLPKNPVFSNFLSINKNGTNLDEELEKRGKKKTSDIKDNKNMPDKYDFDIGYVDDRENSRKPLAPKNLGQNPRIILTKVSDMPTSQPSTEIKVISISSNSMYFSNYKLNDGGNEESENLLLSTFNKNNTNTNNSISTREANTLTFSDNNDSNNIGNKNSSNANNESQLTGSCDTPTRSSSVQSASSLSSPVDSSFVLMHMMATPSNSENHSNRLQQQFQRSNSSGNKHLSDKNERSSFSNNNNNNSNLKVSANSKSNTLLNMEDASMSLRRNSYTRAIFSENVK